MSNENSTTNTPRRIRRGCNAPSGRARKFSCITYLNELQLKVCLLKHPNQIRVYAYAYHDKDLKEDGTLKEPHFHLILITYNTCSVSAIRRWFTGYVDEKGMEITTTAQICSDVFEMYDYLTHSTRKAIEDGKYQYDKSIIQTNDPLYFQADEESDFDSVTLATEMLLKGRNVRDLGKIFGRDFILHYNTIKQYANDVIRHEKYNMSFEDVVDREYEMELYKLNE